MWWSAFFFFLFFLRTLAGPHHLPLVHFIAFRRRRHGDVVASQELHQRRVACVHRLQHLSTGPDQSDVRTNVIGPIRRAYECDWTNQTGVRM